VEICERNNSADTKVNEKGGGGGVPGAGAEIRPQPVAKTMLTHVVPLQPMEVHSRAGPLLRTPHLRSWISPEGGYKPVENPNWRWLLAGPVTLWRGAHARAGFL